MNRMHWENTLLLALAPRHATANWRGAGRAVIGGLAAVTATPVTWRARRHGLPA